MRIFKSREFTRFAGKGKLSDLALCRAVASMQAGLIDADLGGGVYKQRVSRPGAGKSGGFRTILLLRIGEVAIFVHGFAKSDRDNISLGELTAFRKIAKRLLLEHVLIETAIAQGNLVEVKCDAQAVQE